MYDAILVPTDGSETAERALDAILPLATSSETTVHVVTVFDLGEVSRGLRADARESLDSYGEEITTSLASVAESAGVDTVTEIIELDGPVHEALATYVDDHDIDLVAMGTRGAGGIRQIAVGSITRRTLREVPVPVFTVTPDARVDGTIDSILHPTDGSPGSVAAAEHALELCSAFDATLHVINVVDVSGPWSTLESSDLLVAFEAAGQDAVDDIIERAHEHDLSSVQASVLNGIPAEVITRYVEEHEIDLIAMGTHGRRGLDRLLLGSVAEAVIASATVPVLAVKGDEAT